MASLRDYLMLGRIHTSALTWSALLIGYFLAGQAFDIRVFYFIALGVLYHYWGFLANNISDLKFDLKDPAKAHHPLVRGVIPVQRAVSIDGVVGIVTVGVGLLLSLGNIPALGVLVISMVMALLYNQYCKVSLLGPVFICLAWPPLFLYSYLIYSPLTATAVWVFIFMVVAMGFQIAYSGYYKDIKQTDEVNLLRRLGARTVTSVTSVIFVSSRRTAVFSYGLSAAKVLLLLPIIQHDLSILIPVFFSYVIVLIFTNKITHTTIYNRTRSLRDMSLIEIFTFWMLLFALAPEIGILPLAFIILASLLWFTAFNRLFFFTFLYPKV